MCWLCPIDCWTEPHTVPKILNTTDILQETELLLTIRTLWSLYHTTVTTNQAFWCFNVHQLWIFLRCIPHQYRSFMRMCVYERKKASEREGMCLIAMMPWQPLMELTVKFISVVIALNLKSQVRSKTCLYIWLWNDSKNACVNFLWIWAEYSIGTQCRFLYCLICFLVYLCRYSLV